jgi:hypothetical protein
VGSASIKTLYDRAGVTPPAISCRYGNNDGLVGAVVTDLIDHQSAIGHLRPWNRHRRLVTTLSVLSALVFARRNGHRCTD